MRGFETWDYTLATDAKPPKHKIGGWNSRYLEEALAEYARVRAEVGGSSQWMPIATTRKIVTRPG